MKIIKFILGFIGAILLLAIISYILYIVPLIVGIPFMIVLALIMGFFGVKIKISLDKRRLLDEATDKIDKQKYHMKTQEITDATLGPQLERPTEQPKGWGVEQKVPIPEAPQEVVKEIVPEEVQKEISKDIEVQVEGMDSLVTIETYEPEEKVVKKRIVKPKKIVKKKKKKRVKRVVEKYIEEGEDLK